MLKFKNRKVAFKNLFGNSKSFGCKVAFSQFFVELLNIGQKTKHKVILKYLENHYKSLILDYKHRKSDEKPLQSDCPIWICWFQGEKCMPPIVRGCYNSVKRHAGLHPVKLITIANYKEYVTIPQYIITKLDNKEISYTHFSDIIRNNLLADYGGIWLDATIYLTDKLKGWDKSFYSIKQNCPNDYKYVSGYKWTGFCMGGIKDNLLNSFVKDFFNVYHQKEDNLIDYFLIDYIIALGYNNIPSIKRLIDDVPLSNPSLYFLQQNLDKIYNQKEFDKIKQNTYIFKVTWKLHGRKYSTDSYYQKIISNLI